MRIASKKRTISFLLALGLTASGLLGCSGGQAPSATDGKEPYKIGVILDVTGAGSALGVPDKNAAELARDEINAKGGINGHPVELLILDNESDETKTILNFKKLAEDPKVIAVVGAAQSGTTMAMVKPANDMQVPLISVASNAAIISPVEERKWVFKTPQNDSAVAEKIVDYMKAKGMKTAASLAPNNAFGDNANKAFLEIAQKNGIEVTLVERFSPTDKDFTPQLLNVRKANPDATVVWAVPPAASILTKQYRELGLTPPMIHNHGIGNQNFIELAGPSANGIIFPIGRVLIAEQLPDSDPQKQMLIAFNQAYEAKYGPRSTFASHSYDAFQLLFHVIGQVGPDRAKVRDALENTKNFVGAGGIFNLSPQDHNGLTKDALVMVEVVDGKWKLIE